jgi:hypothetical protein
MRRLLIAITLCLAVVPTLASAARSASTFRVGITIEHDCTVERAPDGGGVDLRCSAGTAAAPAVYTLSGADARAPSGRVEAAPITSREAAESGATRLVVEF